MTYVITAQCPECGYDVDDATGIGEAEGDRPEPDSVAICIQCAGLGIYELKEDGTLGLRLPTYEEKIELSENQELTEVREKILAFTKWFQT